MKINKITMYTDLLLSAAISKCISLDDAQDLAKETVLRALKYSGNGGESKNAKAWFISVLNKKFRDMLRKSIISRQQQYESYLILRRI